MLALSFIYIDYWLVVSLGLFENRQKGQQLNQHLRYFVIYCAIPIIAVLWWWGMFSSAEIVEKNAPAYRYAYLEVEGPYSKLSNKQAEVAALLKQQHIEYTSPITLMMSDPRVTQYKQRVARTGFLLNADGEVAEPLKLDTLPARTVVNVSIKAHPLFAYGKAYGALVKYCEQRGAGLQLPTVEIVEHSQLTVQMPLRKE